MKKIILYTSIFLSGLYTIFIAQTLWNWFVISVLPVSHISFLQTAGLFLIMSVFSKSEKTTESNYWEIAFKILEISLPELKKQDVQNFLKKKEEEMFSSFMLKVIEQFMINTLTLLVGFIISI